MADRYHCPRCGSELRWDGDARIGGDVIRVYACPQCRTGGELDASLAMPLSFIIGPDGKPFDPGGLGGHP